MFRNLVKRMENKKEERRLATEQYKYESVFGGKDFEFYEAVSNANKLLDQTQMVLDKIKEEKENLNTQLKSNETRIKTNEEIKREFKEQRRLRKLAEEKAKQEKLAQEKAKQEESKKETISLPLPATNSVKNNDDEKKNEQIIINNDNNVDIQQEEEIDEIEALVRLAYQMQDEDSVIDDAEYIIL